MNQPLEIVVLNFHTNISAKYFYFNSLNVENYKPKFVSKIPWKF